LKFTGILNFTGAADMVFMIGVRLWLFSCFFALFLPATAGEITGKISITKGLTKPKVTLPAYQGRGPALPYGPAEHAEPASIADELGRVVVYIESDRMAPPTPIRAEISQRNRGFVPEMAVITAGSTVSFPNMDLIFHNVFSLSKVKGFDLGRYPAGETRSIKFDKPGVVKVHCHLHSNMAAVIVVVPSDWYARPESDGGFRMEGVPAGQYTAVAWHNSIGFSKKRIHVTDSGSVTVNFAIPLRDRVEE
jgi:plastocyanin